MSTRCSVIIKYGNSVIYAYRHWDGYPAVTGANLLELIDKAKRDNSALVALLFDENYPEEERRAYQFTTDRHGDVDHAYTISLTRSGNPPTIHHAERPSSKPELADWVDEGTTYRLDKFADVVNADRRAINQRMETARRTNPGNAHYQGLTDMPAIAAPAWG